MNNLNKNLYWLNYIKNLDQIPQNIKNILKKLIFSFKEQQDYCIKFINKFPKFSKTVKLIQ